ncbi:hypothetical protein CROQUDRAFT_62281 [Cronartium quercuum f. sp. fusiforme G11]|uniref:PXA domain-containing protein n=1 Tax=Cronartium quercuum f. sp. fusiforme G11 TaxID=708437 RepID=A0A9P6TCM5_9BASI|nr:hypothetical protein CROQUDRAFT_62281 [Cronartium quercuum f. sp. fusiforme G11]
MSAGDVNPDAALQEAAPKQTELAQPPELSHWFAVHRPSNGSIVAFILVSTVLVGYRNILAITSCFIIYFATVFLAIVAFNLGLPYWIQRHEASRATPRREKRTAYRMRFSTPAAYSASQIKKTWETRSDWRHEQLHPKLEQMSASILDRLLMKIIRDFVWKASWYDTLVPPPYGTLLASAQQVSQNTSPDTYSSPSFPLAVEKVIRHCLRVIFLRLERLDILDMIIHKILPILTTHIEAFRQAESDLRGGDNIGGRTGHRSSRRDSRGGIYGAFFSSGNDEIDLLLARLHAEVLQKKNTEAKQNLNSSGNPDGPRPTIRLHPAVDVPTPNSQSSEQAHLRRLLEIILPIVLPPAEANSRAVRILVIELLTCSIIGPVIEMLSDSDFWNRFIEERAGNVIREQKMVEQLREVLDRQSSLVNMNAQSDNAPHLSGLNFHSREPPDSSVSKSDNRSGEEALKGSSFTDHYTSTDLPTTRPADRISVKSTVKDFERFSRSIHRCNTLFDARRLKNDIETQIRKTEALLSGQINFEETGDPENRQNVSSTVITGLDSSQTQPRDLMTYLDRLQAVKDTADRRITELGGTGGPIHSNKQADPWSGSVNVYSRQHQLPQNALPSQFGHKPNHILQAILRDRESAALSYFTEFMDRRQRVNLIQFWLAVDGLKDPLEEELLLEDDLSVRLRGKGHTPNPLSISSFTTRMGEDDDRNNRDREAMKDDLKAIAEINFGSLAATTSLGLREEDVRPLLLFLSMDSDSSQSESTTIITGKSMYKLNNVREAKARLFNMQQKVFDSMLSEDFPAFAASGDLYLRATASVILRPSHPYPSSSNGSICEETTQVQGSGPKLRPVLSSGLSMSPIKSKSPPARFAPLVCSYSTPSIDHDPASEGPISPKSVGQAPSKVRPYPLLRSNSDEPLLRPTNPLKLLSQYQSFRTKNYPSSNFTSSSQPDPLAVTLAQSSKRSDRPRITGGVALSAVLPPQVTLQAAFDERLPSERLTGTTQSNNRPALWHSKNAVNTEQVKVSALSPSSSSSSHPSNHHPISSSLDFLMGPSEGDRAPLFGEDVESHQLNMARLMSVSRQGTGRKISSQSDPHPRLDSDSRDDTYKTKTDEPARTNVSRFPLLTEPSMNMAASIALQEALSSILSTADDEKASEGTRLPRSASSETSTRVKSPRPNITNSDQLAFPKSSSEENQGVADRKGSSVLPFTLLTSQSQSPMTLSVRAPTDNMAQRKGLFDDDEEDDDQDSESDDWNPRQAPSSSSQAQSTSKSNSIQTLRDLGFDSRTRGSQIIPRERPQSRLMITGLSDADERILKLENQLNLLSSLMRRAELTGNKLEIRLVQKSIDSVSRELSEVIYQKTKMIEQKEIEVGGFRAKLVPGRVRVSITGTTVGRTVSHGNIPTSTTAKALNLTMSPPKSTSPYSTIATATGLMTGGPSDVVLYTIEVHKLTEEDGSFGSGWIVTRRYNEFNLLHKSLKDRYPIARQLDFPAKIIGIGIGMSIGSSNSKTLIEQRKLALERYLRSLIQIPVLCESPDLAAFLSRSRANLPSLKGDSTTSLRRQMELFARSGFVRSVYKSITSSGISNVDEAEERGRNVNSSSPSIFEAMMSGLRQQAHEFAYGFTAGSSAVVMNSSRSSTLPSTGTANQSNALVKQVEELSPKVQDEDYDGDTLANLTTNVRPIEGELLTPFTAPICDCLIEIFELNDKNQWLRKQGIVIVLQQILGGTIERKLREAVTEYLNDEHLSQLILMLEESLWLPENEGGNLKLGLPPRTFEQKILTRDGAYYKLSAIIPDLAASVLGRSNARRGIRRLFSMCQNRRLNKHLIYTINEKVLRNLFPEANI